MVNELSYREIVENANSIVVKLDLKGNITFINKYAHSYFGFSLDSILGENVMGTILPDKENGGFSKEELKEIIRNIENYPQLENWNVTQKGEKRYISWNNKPLFNERGVKTGVISIGTDITKLKLLAEELAESESKFKMIFNSVSDGIMIFLPSGKIIEVNQTVIDRSGYSKKEFGTITMQMLLSNHPLMTFDNLVEELGGENYVMMELSYTNKQGRELHLEVTTKKVKYYGIDAYIAVSREISDRIDIQHKIYNAVLMAEEAERERIAKELHDGVSPVLSTAKLYAQSLKDCKDPEIIKEIINKVESTINHAVLSISEISSNLSPHVLKNFGLIRALENYIDSIIETNNIEIDFKTNVNVAFINAIEVSLYRILTELLHNTIKYAGASKIEISLHDKGLIYLKYKDNGIGFDYDKRNSKRKGMGLYNIYNRVKSLKGYIRISSKSGEGFKVEIELPKQMQNQ